MNGGRMVNVATDGETYGHHFKFGDLALAHALAVEARARGYQVTNYGEFLDQHPPELGIELKRGAALADGSAEGTAWSCSHGLGRWTRDCGCHTGGADGWQQAWRAPLRLALDYLRDETVNEFESIGGDLLVDPWEARNDYIKLILDHGRSREEFLARHSRQTLSPMDQLRALSLLEIQRNALLMYTSCGWFFSELSGIETLQIMKYAARDRITGRAWPAFPTGAVPGKTG
jgi:alpha-amylase/alpha-mannosidase (GH57 family)